MKIQNIEQCSLMPPATNEHLDLEFFYKDYNVFGTYQPNMFPGLIYRPMNVPVVFLVFFSGKVVMGRLVHTCLGSSSLIAHVRHCPPSPHANSFIGRTAVINNTNGAAPATHP